MEATAAAAQLQPVARPKEERKKVSRACESCRVNKAKCDGNQPCPRCLARQTICIYTDEEDKRVKGSLKRKLDQLEADNAFYRGLFHDLRFASVQQIQYVATLLGQNGSPEDVRSYLHHTVSLNTGRQSEAHDKLDGAAVDITDGQGRAGTTDSTSLSRNKVFDIGRIIDNPPHQVSAAPWTSVTHDDSLVSHLVSLWATWGHTWPSGVVLEYFLRDMRTRQMESQFCSPFLVNCILANGCFFSDYEETGTKKGKYSPMVDLFVKEALHHFEREKSRPSITNVQGLPILGATVAQMNQDRLTFNYVSQAKGMCTELCRSSVRQRLFASASSEQQRQEMSYVLDVATWEVSAHMTYSLLAFQHPQHAVIPVRPYPEHIILPLSPLPPPWTPYPNSNNQESVHGNSDFRHHTKVHVLTCELAHMLHVQEHPPSAAALEDFLRRLTSSYDDLAEEIFKSTNPASAFYLRIWWITILLTALISQKQHCVDVEELSKINARLVKYALDISRFTQSSHTFAREGRVSASTIQPLQQALNILLDMNSEKQHDSEINELFTVLYAMGRRMPFIMSAVRTIQLDAQRRGIELPTATMEIFNDFDQNNLTKDQLPNSLYPYPGSAFAAASENESSEDSNRRRLTMGEFLEIIENMTVQEQTSEQAGEHASEH